MTTRLKTLTLAICILALAATTAIAQEIYLNGVRLAAGALTDTTLDRVDEVQFDEQGNLHIVAPRYQVQVEGDPSARSPEAMARLLQGQYFLVIQNPNADRHRYTTTVRINGHDVAEVPTGQSIHHMEVTQYLQLGSNAVFVEFRRDDSPSGSADHRLSVVVGRGSLDEGRLEIRRRVVNVSVDGTHRGARETHDAEFSIERE